MVTLTISKEQCLELFMALNVRPNQLASIERLEDLVEARHVLRDVGKGFVKAVEQKDIDAIQYLDKIKRIQQGSPTKAEKQSIEDLVCIVKGLGEHRAEYVAKFKDDVIKVKLGDKIFNSVREAFTQIGKEFYSQQDGGLEAFVGIKHVLDKAITSAD